MKKALLLLASAALLFAGCAKEQVSATADDGQTVEVTVSTQILGGRQAKASWDGDGNGACVNRWVMEVYDVDGVLFDRQVKTNQSGLYNSFKLTLIKNQSYKFAFWADTENSYDVSDLRAVKTVSTVAGLDSRDAFFVEKDYTSSKSETISAQLTRPFSQINVVTRDLNKIYKQMEKAGTTSDYAKFIPVELKLKGKIYNQFNVLTGEVSEEAEATLTLAECYANYAQHKDSTTIFMDYGFAAAGKELKNLTFSFKSNGETVSYDFANIPLQRNYRTNISGNLLSNDATVNVEIVPIWEKPDYEEELWSAGMITPVTPDEEGVYNISRPSELAWIAQQVNSGATTFTGETVKLLNDIDLNNGAWTPIGGLASYPSVAFHGTLDGNGFTIRNLNCSDTTPEYATAALIGAGRSTVKNLTIENVKITSSHYAAAIVAYVSDEALTIENCHVKGGSIVSTPEIVGDGYDNGDKVGGILGYSAIQSTITGCSVEDLTIKAYRDLGGIAGATHCDNIADNTVKNTTIISDQTIGFYGKKDCNAGAIVGRPLSGTVAESNTSENVVIKTFANSVEKALDEAEPGETVTVPASETSIGAITIPVDIADNVILKAADGAKVDEIVIPDGADISNFTIKGFEGNRSSTVPTQSGFVAINAEATVENLVVEDCNVIGPGSKTGGAGVWIQSSTAEYPKTVTVKNCDFSELRYGFYTSNAIAGVSLVFDGCSFTNMFSWAILVNNGAVNGIDVQNCTFSGGDLVKTLEGGKDPDVFTFTFKNNTVTGATANFSLKAKPERTFISGNTKNGEAWTPSIGAL